MLPFLKNLQKAKFEKRYKRFFVDAVLEDGTEVTAHCPNTGSMKSCLNAGATIWLSAHDDPKRKLKFTLELVETAGGYIGVNTMLPNKIVELGIAAGLVKELSGYTDARREVKYGTNSRIDLLLQEKGLKDCFVEVKNTTLFDGENVLFPDAVTERGQKHLMELAEVVKNGHRGVIFFLANRPEGKAFLPADHIDPVYGKLLREVSKKGVEVLAYRAKHSLQGITLGEQLAIRLD